METTKGTVEGVFSRKTTTGKNIWSFKLSGDPRFYRTSFTKPTFEEGNAVSFNYEEDKYGNQVDLTSVKLLKAVAEAAPTKGVEVSKGSFVKENYEARAKYWEDKEKRDVHVQEQIRWQSANNAAIAFLNLAQSVGVLPVPAPRAKDKFGALMDLMAKVREDFIRGVLETGQVGSPPDVAEEENEDETDENWETE